MAAPPLLLHFRVSHYNEKVRWALDHKGWAHHRKAYVPGMHLLPVRIRTGQRKLPVLLIDDEAIVGSEVILEELEKRRPGKPLFPEDPKLRERAVALSKHFDDVVAPDLRRLFWSGYLDRPADCGRMATMGSSGLVRTIFRCVFPMIRPLFARNMGATHEGIAAARKRLSSHFDRLESEIGSSGFLVGDRFGVADLTAAAIMSAIIRPPQFSYPLPEPQPPGLVELREAVSKRTGFRWVLDTYERHRGTSSEIRALATS